VLERRSVSENLALTAPIASGVAQRIAAASLARRGLDYEGEVRRLLDAAFAVVERNGTAARARVADIVAEAGLSNEAFYRHFPSKDALVAALIEDGALRLASYVAHQMDKEPAPADQVRRWVAGVLSQTAGTTAAATVAVLWNGSRFDAAVAPGSQSTTAPLAALLHEPLAALGSPAPELHASLVSQAVVGTVSQHLWARTQPTRREVDQITRFCLAAVGAGA
jgi:AcrR family transcriptional regulator